MTTSDEARRAPAQAFAGRLPRGGGALIAGLILAAGCGGGATEGATQGATYGISGAISGAGSHAVAVTLSSAALGNRVVRTDSSGRYAFAGIPAGTYTVTPALQGFSMEPASAVATVDRADVTGVSFTCRPLLEVWGRDLGAEYQNLDVAEDGVGVNDATVTVNGEVMTHPAGFYQDGYYGGQLTNALGAGATIVLEVTRGGRTVTATGSVPEAPILTAPANGAAFAPGDAVSVAWTSATQPDRFTVSATWSCGPGCGTGASFDVGGAQRAFTIPASGIPTGLPITLRVFAYNGGTFSGDYLPHGGYPGMNIRAEWGQVVVQR
ncbi:hypothetical protein [Anaeromyxobacter diazotrophicus]|uniref:Carboxypeptidase family protein n=1 Tax=Anaeromyxobacter diazotrophicus TaxID=2590199 RepID=A0A7I9VR24_9BACT|nr:hypothetical protein [Anaeromyxobacter diazotrophicus]GEJ58708.1 hypothetical protein AMYX_34490 [Anaeromyxobacter diazotrophicus]